MAAAFLGKFAASALAGTVSRRLKIRHAGILLLQGTQPSPENLFPKTTTLSVLKKDNYIYMSDISSDFFF
jgi:hypothetical protein